MVEYAELGASGSAEGAAPVELPGELGLLGEENLDDGSDG